MALLAMLPVFLQPGTAGAAVASAAITYFSPAAGSFYAGDYVTSSLGFENTGAAQWTFWVSYGVRDAAGRWYNVTSNAVTVGAGVESPVQTETWQVPYDPLLTTGNFTVAMAVWLSPPETPPATQVAYVERADSFQAFEFLDAFNRFDTSRWYKSNYAYDSGNRLLSSGNVNVASNLLGIKIPANTNDGGELGSKNAYLYGTYRVLMKCPPVSGAMCAFFLYQPTGGAAADEIDIEIPIGRNAVYLTTYQHGVHSNCADPPQKIKCKYTNDPPIALAFDPASAYHEYRIDFYPNAVSFYIDGALKKTWTSGLPTNPMVIETSTSMPAWLSGTRQATDNYLYVAWIQH